MDRMTTTYHHDHDAKLGLAKSGGGINNGLIITVPVQGLHGQRIGFSTPIKGAGMDRMTVQT